MSFYKTVEIDGRKVSYTDGTKFEVQIGKNDSSYKTLASYNGSPQRAMIHFNGLNVHSGYKKRLYSADMNIPVLARVITK